MLDKHGVFTPLLKEFLKEAMNGELEAHNEEQFFYLNVEK